MYPGLPRTVIIPGMVWICLGLLRDGHQVGLDVLAMDGHQPMNGLYLPGLLPMVINPLGFRFTWGC